MTEPADLVRHLIDKLIDCYEARLNEREQLGRFWAHEAHWASQPLPDSGESVGSPGQSAGSVMSQLGAGTLPLSDLNGNAQFTVGGTPGGEAWVAGSPPPAEPTINPPWGLVFRLCMSTAGQYEPHRFVDCRGPIIGCRPLDSESALLLWVHLEQVHLDDQPAVRAAMQAHPGRGQYQFEGEAPPLNDEPIPF